MIGAVASNTAVIAAVTQPGVSGGAQQALSALQPPAHVASETGGSLVSTVSSTTVVSEVATTSANGIVTWQITYADGSTGTMTTYGPIPSSTLSIVV